MHNFGTVLRFELTRTLRKPTFWLSILSIPALFGIIIAVIYFSNKTEDDRQKDLSDQKFSLLVQDESGIVNSNVISAFGATRTTDKQAAIDKVKTGQLDAFFYYPSDLSKGSIEVYNKNVGISDNSKYTTVAETLAKSSATASVASPSVAAVLQDTVKTDQTNYKDGEKINPLGQLIPPAIFLLIFYAIIVLLGNQMLTSTTEEKENRVTEMLLTSISSRALIVGKIVALIILGFVQILVILVPALLAYIFAREALNIPDISSFLTGMTIEPGPMALGAALLVTGFMLFTGLLVGIGAATPTAKEANSFFGFVILLMIVPFYFFALLMSPSSSPIVTGLSYFPLTAPFTLLIRNAFGTLPLHEALIGLTIVTLSSIIALALAIRIFRYGTLEYSKTLSLRSILGRK